MVRFPLLAPKRKPLHSKGFSVLSLCINGFFDARSVSFVCVHIQKYVLIYALCKTQMQNKLQEIGKIILQLILDRGFTRGHEMAVDGFDHFGASVSHVACDIVHGHIE